MTSCQRALQYHLSVKSPFVMTFVIWQAIEIYGIAHPPNHHLLWHSSYGRLLKFTVSPIRQITICYDIRHMAGYWNLRYRPSVKSPFVMTLIIWHAIEIYGIVHPSNHHFLWHLSCGRLLKFTVSPIRQITICYDICHMTCYWNLCYLSYIKSRFLWHSSLNRHIRPNIYGIRHTS